LNGKPGKRSCPMRKKAKKMPEREPVDLFRNLEEIPVPHGRSLVKIADSESPAGRMRFKNCIFFGDLGRDAGS